MDYPLVSQDHGESDRNRSSLDGKTYSSEQSGIGSVDHPDGLTALVEDR